MVVGRSLAVSDLCLVILSFLKGLEDGGGRCGKPSAVFQGPVGAFFASTGPAASTASSSEHGSGSFDHTPVPIRGTLNERAASSAWTNTATRRSSHRAIVDPEASCAVVFSHEAASGRLGVAFPRRFACSVRKLETSNSSRTE